MADQTTDNPLISTKLKLSQVVGDHVHRIQLLERLDQRYQRSLTQVSAPAGYGKTALISGWRESGKPKQLKNVYLGEQLVYSRNSFDAFTAGVRMTWREGKRK